MRRPAPPDLALHAAERRIDWVLAHPGMSPWLKDALRSALDCDPVQVLNDLELLRHLLQARTDAIVRRRLGEAARP